MMVGEKEKKERTTAARRFTNTYNRLNEAIEHKSKPEIILGKLKDLTLLFENLQSTHDAYLVTLHPEDDEPVDKAEDDWLRKYEEKFDVVEKATSDYLYLSEQLTRQYEEELRKESQYTKLSQLIMTNKQKRDSLKFMFTQELKGIEDFIKMDVEGLLKSQVILSMNGAKSQLDKCKDAHLEYISLLNSTDPEAENSWIEEVYTLYDECSKKMYAYLATIAESEARQKRKVNLKMERIKMPEFIGEVRNYAKFKADFKRQVEKEIDCPATLAYVLKSCLSKEALDIVKNMEEDVVKIWSRLDERYGQPSLLIDTVMNELKNISWANEGDSKSFVQFVDVIERGYTDLCRLNVEREMSNSITVSMIEGRLPPIIKREWSKEVNKTDSKVDPFNKFPHLMQFLREQRRILEYEMTSLRELTISDNPKMGLVNNLQAASQKDNENMFDPKNERDPYRHPGRMPPTQFKCILHRTNNHSTTECRTYINKEPHARFELLRQLRACWGCLKTGHQTADCPTRRLCGLDNCSEHHHQTLHMARRREQIFHADLYGYSEACQNVPSFCLLPIMMVQSINTKLNVLWDSGASICLVTFKMATLLKLKGKGVELSVVKVGGDIEIIPSRVYSLPLTDKCGRTIQINAYGIERISQDIRNVKIDSIVHKFKDLQKGDVTRPEGEVDVIVGINCGSLYPSVEQSLGELILLGNRFGKCLAGSYNGLQMSDELVIQPAHVNLVTRIEDSFLELEALSVKCDPQCGRCGCGKCCIGGKGMSIKEEREQNQINEGLVYMDGYFMAHYPWTKDPNELPNNKVMALKLLESTERRLLKESDLAQMYCDGIKDMLDRKVARKLTSKEIKEYDGPVYYISHHEVINNSSTSTPCRIVFNSSAKFLNHVLNDYWGKGVNLVNNLLGIHIRFREKKTGAVGDIRKMYHAVKISVLDQHTHRFLWRDLEVNRTPDTYVMTSVSFGDKPAGNIAIAALQKTAEMGKEKFPAAANIVVNNTYIDDVIDSFDNLESAKEVTGQIEDLIKAGGFDIKEWIFSACNEINEKDCEVKIGGKLNEEPKVLGVRWNRFLDVLKYTVKVNLSPKKRGVRQGKDLKRDEIPGEIPPKLTKRMILSLINSIFDPLGLLTPFTVVAKFILKEIWKKDLQWDEEIEAEDWQRIVEFIKNTFELETISFERCMKPDGAIGNPSLVTFSDASNNAFGACSYFRWEMQDGSYSSVLIASKNRVAPMRTLSIVRLELCGAVVGKRLAEFIEKETRYIIERKYFFVDSLVLKGMINKQSYTFNTFVAIRLGEIQEGTDVKDWHWIGSQYNIADWITRGKKPSELGASSEWQKGPAFLAKNENEWPVNNDAFVESLPEEKQSANVSHIIQKPAQGIANIMDAERFSKYLALIHVTARLISVYRYIPKPSIKNLFNFPVDFLEEAEKAWIREAQKPLRGSIKKGNYRRLCPKETVDGIIIVGGRITKLFMDNYNTPGLVLLPHDHRLSRLYAEYVHSWSHLATASTVCKIRNKFWITKLTPMVKNIRNKCVKCKRLDPQCEQQIMGDLPMERLKPSPAFYYTFVDFFGPFVIRGVVHKRVHGKAFGVLFTCAYSRAVHCELSTDYSLDGFMQVLRRFTSIRGYPNSIYSDRGSQLVATDKELRGLIKGFDEEKLRQFGADKGMKWNFSPPDAPWRNGCVEALVKSIKKSLKVAVGDQVLLYPELQTVLYEAANLVNERPIGMHSNQIEDENYLCPNDLLLGRASSRVPSGPFAEQCSSKRRYMFVQSIANAFWRKWIKDFFPSLLIRQKWHHQKRNVEAGDIVLIRDSNVVRGEWRLGKVAKAYKDENNIVRTIDIRYRLPDKKKFTIVKRAVQSVVVLLPVEDANS